MWGGGEGEGEGLDGGGFGEERREQRKIRGGHENSEKEVLEGELVGEVEEGDDVSLSWEGDEEDMRRPLPWLSHGVWALRWYLLCSAAQGQLLKSYCDEILHLISSKRQRKLFIGLWVSFSA